jgi:hypothetical protein
MAYSYAGNPMKKPESDAEKIINEFESEERWNNLWLPLGTITVTSAVAIALWIMSDAAKIVIATICTFTPVVFMTYTVLKRRKNASRD